MATDEAKDLYKLIGKYEATTRQIFSELKSINGRLDEGNETFDEIKKNCNNAQRVFDNHERRLEDIEESGVPKKTRWEIRGSSITAAALAIWEAFKIITGFGK